MRARGYEELLGTQPFQDHKNMLVTWMNYGWTALIGDELKLIVGLFKGDMDNG